MGRLGRHKPAIAAAGAWTSLLILLLSGCCQAMEGPGTFDVRQNVRPSYPSSKLVLACILVYHCFDGQLL